VPKTTEFGERWTSAGRIKEWDKPGFIIQGRVKYAHDATAQIAPYFAKATFLDGSLQGPLGFVQEESQQEEPEAQDQPGPNPWVPDLDTSSDSESGEDTRGAMEETGGIRAEDLDESKTESSEGSLGDLMEVQGNEQGTPGNELGNELGNENIYMTPIWTTCPMFRVAAFLFRVDQGRSRMYREFNSRVLGTEPVPFTSRRGINIYG